MYQKVFITKHIIEIKEYSSLNLSSSVYEGIKAPPGTSLDYIENYKKTCQDRRDNIRRLVIMNFDSNSKFITFTFKSNLGFNIKDPIACNKHWDIFMKRLRRLYPKIKYIAVIEFQDKNERGAVHYHMICDLPYIKKSVLQELWQVGFIKINAIDKVDNIGAYVIKYATKDNGDDRLQGIKAYNCSKGLKRPSEIKSWEAGATEMLKIIKELIKDKNPVYQSTYKVALNGSQDSDTKDITVSYCQYNLIR
jgi:hypothetical protein